MNNYPRISIVTPTLNQGRYIAATIHSVMDQGYPNLEYTIIDGGSTDETHAVVARLKKEYGDAFQFEIVNGLGQVGAINKGLAASTGQIMAYLNSDDIYLPGVFLTVAHHFRAQPQVKWLTAPTISFGENRPEVSICGDRTPSPDVADWFCGNFVMQPSTFWTSVVYQELGAFSETYKYIFDFEYWLRFVAKGYTPIHLKCPLSAFRLHATSFSCTRQDLFREEHQRLELEWLLKLPAAGQRRLRARFKNRKCVQLQTQAMQTAAAGHTLLALAQWYAGVRHAPRMLFRLDNYLRLRRVFFPKSPNPRHP